MSTASLHFRSASAYSFLSSRVLQFSSTGKNWFRTADSSCDISPGNSTSTSVAAAIGTEPSINGLNFHVFAASTAEVTSIGCPLTTLTDDTSPDGDMTMCSL